jgi:hypothetical protein
VKKQILMARISANYAIESMREAVDDVVQQRSTTMTLDDIRAFKKFAKKELGVFWKLQ